MTFINLPLYFLKLCVSDYGFTLKRAPSNLLKWHHIRYGMEVLKTILSFLKIWVYETFVWHAQNTKLDKCYFVKVIPKGLVFLYHYTKAKLFVVKNGVFWRKQFLAKEWVGGQCNLSKIDESSNKCAAEPHRLDKTRTNIYDVKTRYCCSTMINLWYTKKRWWALTPGFG
jgi:hypothetical protein